MSKPSEDEDWLAVLLWTAETFLNPSPSRVLETFESWAHRNRLRPRLRRLEQRELICPQVAGSDQSARLTEHGRLAALGGRDPVKEWNRPWDGEWRLLLFDLPRDRQSSRVKLLRWLRQHHFGYLQNSVWLHPHPVLGVERAIKDVWRDVEMLTLMEASCAPGYTNSALVLGAWNFALINARYEAYLRFTEREIPPRRKSRSWHDYWRGWLRQERVAWLAAIELDPFLPKDLLPRGYLGVHAVQAREQVFAQLQVDEPERAASD